MHKLQYIQSLKSNVCKQQKKQKATDDQVGAIIAHVHFENDTYTTMSAVNKVDLIPAKVRPALTKNHLTPTSEVKIFPDSGAGICLAGPQHLPQMGISKNSLIPCNKVVSAVGGSKLSCPGWIPVEFTVGKHSTTQPLYVCEKVDRIYFSREGSIDVKILPESFPSPMDEGPERVNAIQHQSNKRLSVIPYLALK